MSPKQLLDVPHELLWRLELCYYRRWQNCYNNPSLPVSEILLLKSLLIEHRENPNQLTARWTRAPWPSNDPNYPFFPRGQNASLRASKLFSCHGSSCLYVVGKGGLGLRKVQFFQFDTVYFAHTSENMDTSWSQQRDIDPHEHLQLWGLLRI